MEAVLDVVDDRAERFDRFVRATELPLALLALLIVPALMLEDRAQTWQLRDLALAINWFVWLAFCVEYAGKLALSPNWRAQVVHGWFDLLIIVLSPPFLVPQALQGARAIRVLRLLRFLRGVALAAMALRMASDVLSHRRFHYVALATGVIVALGAVGIYGVEHGVNQNISSMGEAVWWAVVATASVGYGDVPPITPEGRLIAFALMIVGIGFAGVFTATLTSFFVDQGKEAHTAEMARLEERLARLEAKQDEVIDALRQRVF